MMNMTTSREESDLIHKLAERGEKLSKKYDMDYDKLDITMDLTACHCNGTPLDLKKMLEATDGNFGHDLFGIYRHINRDTGKLGNCFLPRCAALTAVK